MQITTGLVSVTNGSPTVNGNASVDWSQVNDDCLFIHLGQTYEIVAVDALLKTLTLSIPFKGATASNQTYVIVRDFTTNLDLPLLNPGDLEAAALFSRLAWIIDSVLGTGVPGTPSLGEIVINQTAHGFIVGNFLRLNGSAWVLANSSSEPNATVVGCVKEVVNANQFKIVTQGRIANVAGITMTAGSLYYLRNSSVSGGGGQVNLTDSLGSVGIKVPVIVADGPTSGYILNLARASGSIFSTLVNGLVPGPSALDVSQGRVLGAGGGWVLQGVANGSILSQHLDQSTGVVNWPSFVSNGTNLSVWKHLVDLHTRLSSAEGFNRRTVTTTLMRDKVYNGPMPYEVKSFTVPAGVASLKLYAYSGTVPGDTLLSPVQTRPTQNQVYVVNNDISMGVELLLDVDPGDIIKAEIGPAWTGGDQTTQYSAVLVLKRNDVTFATIRKVTSLGSSKYSPVVLSGSEVHLVGALNAGRELHRISYNFTINSDGNAVLTDNTVVEITKSYPCISRFFGTAFVAEPSVYGFAYPGLLIIQYET